MNNYYQDCVDDYFAFYEQKFGRKPQPSGAEFTALKSIIKKIETITTDAGIPLSKDVVTKSLQKFFVMAYTDGWIANHFNLFNLSKQFDIIVSKSIKKPNTNLTLKDYATSHKAWEELKGNG